MAAEGAPAFKEVSWFTIPEGVEFDAAEPWRLQLMIQRVLSVNDKAFVTADLDYELPKGYYVDDPKAPPVEISAPVEQVAAAASAPESTGIAEDATAGEMVFPTNFGNKFGKPNKVKLLLSVLL